MNTQVYLHSSFTDLVNLLITLKVVGTRRHRILHATFLETFANGMTAKVPGDWVPLPMADIYQNYVEFIPYKERNV